MVRNKLMGKLIGDAIIGVRTRVYSTSTVLPRVMYVALLTSYTRQYLLVVESSSLIFVLLSPRSSLSPPEAAHLPPRRQPYHHGRDRRGDVYPLQRQGVDPERIRRRDCSVAQGAILWRVCPHLRGTEVGNRQVDRCHGSQCTAPRGKNWGGKRRGGYCSPCVRTRTRCVRRCAFSFPPKDASILTLPSCVSEYLAPPPHTLPASLCA